MVEATLLRQVHILMDKLHTLDAQFTGIQYSILAEITALKAEMAETRKEVEIAKNIHSATVAGYWKLAGVLLIWAGTGLGWKEIAALAMK